MTQEDDEQAKPVTKNSNITKIFIAIGIFILLIILAVGLALFYKWYDSRDYFRGYIYNAPHAATPKYYGESPVRSFRKSN